jgi:hypothetical protein
MEYDEDRELTRYVWDYCQGLKTEFERRVGHAILSRTKAARSQSPQMAALISRLGGAIDDPMFNAAITDDPEAFRRRVRERLLSECGPEIFVNRCPSCKRLVRTPQARQCFWCGFDWHG